MRRRWTEDDIAWLVALYPDNRAVIVGEALGRHISHVYATANKLGLRKSPEFIEMDRQEHRKQALSNRNLIKSRFPKGHVPANKGLRRPGWFAGRMRETQFKKGHFPANHDPGFYVLGALRINSDGYIDIRTSFKPGATGWTPLHRYIWVQAHGLVPAGHIVTFIDGDRMNVVLENLQLISMATNARRNYIDRYPKEVRQLVTLKGVITRHVRRIEREALQA